MAGGSARSISPSCQSAATIVRCFPRPRWRSPEDVSLRHRHRPRNDEFRALHMFDSSTASVDAAAPVERFGIPQVVAVGDVSERTLLPSFLYLPAAKEFPPGGLELPWKTAADRVVGAFARDHGAKVPGRLVGSAKSWLSHQGVDRRSPILPWSAPEEVPRLAGRCIIRVSRTSSRRVEFSQGWQGKPERLENQEILLTVPASFDPGARELTIEAATKAGLKNVTLLEEPQAAFYAWLAGQGEQLRRKVKAGDVILVCESGGGTTDFTLIAVKDEAGDLVLSRLAVGEHILLGGEQHGSGSGIRSRRHAAERDGGADAVPAHRSALRLPDRQGNAFL